MLSRSTLLHLRFPFSYFLMPVFFFALGISPNLSGSHLLWSFVIIHLFLYPASNAYNSYFDKDEKSIGGLKNPPPVKKELYTTALCFDGIAIISGFVLINGLFAAMLALYGLVSKLYSHPTIRLKKYPIGGWFITGLFQGFFTFLMCYIGINDFGLENLLQAKVMIPAALTSIMLWGSYPMTQVYQHDEDAKHHDRTLSMMLGVRGTFLFTQGVFGLAALGFVLYFNSNHAPRYSYLFLLALFPVLLFFASWMFRVWRDPSKADFSNTMRLNFLSATCLNAFFIYFFLANSHVGQYF
jgi:1,4-dihydroxy-2-naphthoate octaprenyltransferase